MNPQSALKFIAKMTFDQFYDNIEGANLSISEQIELVELYEKDQASLKNDILKAYITAGEDGQLQPIDEASIEPSESIVDS